jgi:hypothetical protein
MGVGWIDHIYNNMEERWNIRSVDAMHNGTLLHGFVSLDDGGWHGLAPHAGYDAQWCGIPWYWNDERFKAIQRAPNMSWLVPCARFFTLADAGKNWVHWVDGYTGATLGRQEAPNSDFHCILRLENQGVFLDVLATNTSTPDSLAQQILAAAGRPVDHPA